MEYLRLWSALLIAALGSVTVRLILCTVQFPLFQIENVTPIALDEDLIARIAEVLKTSPNLRARSKESDSVAADQVAQSIMEEKDSGISLKDWWGEDEEEWIYWEWERPKQKEADRRRLSDSNIDRNQANVGSDQSNKYDVLSKVLQALVVVIGLLGVFCALLLWFFHFQNHRMRKRQEEKRECQQRTRASTQSTFQSIFPSSYVQFHTTLNSILPPVDYISENVDNAFNVDECHVSTVSSMTGPTIQKPLTANKQKTVSQHDEKTTPQRTPDSPFPFDVVVGGRPRSQKDLVDRKKDDTDTNKSSVLNSPDRSVSTLTGGVSVGSYSPDPNEAPSTRARSWLNRVLNADMRRLQIGDGSDTGPVTLEQRDHCESRVVIEAPMRSGCEEGEGLNEPDKIENGEFLLPKLKKQEDIDSDILKPGRPDSRRMETKPDETDETSSHDDIFVPPCSDDDDGMRQSVLKYPNDSFRQASEDYKPYRVVDYKSNNDLVISKHQSTRNLWCVVMSSNDQCSSSTQATSTAAADPLEPGDHTEIVKTS